MLRRDIEERVAEHIWQMQPDRIVIHPDDVKKTFQSKLFKEQAIDGGPAFGGLQIYVLGDYSAPLCYANK